MRSQTSKVFQFGLNDSDNSQSGFYADVNWPFLVCVYIYKYSRLYSIFDLDLCIADIISSRGGVHPTWILSLIS